jgi:hypothetical protein
MLVVYLAAGSSGSEASVVYWSPRMCPFGFVQSVIDDRFGASEFDRLRVVSMTDAIGECFVSGLRYAGLVVSPRLALRIHKCACPSLP